MKFSAINPQVAHISRPFYLVHLGQLVFQQEGDENSDMLNTKDLYSLLTNFLPKKKLTYHSAVTKTEHPR